MKTFLILVILVLHLQNISAQTPRETRAVWVSTNYRLDWPPPTFDEENQKETLLKIFDDIERKNLNTIYFQVRSNGTVLFKSSYDPFSPYITGKVDLKGSYDPLEFAVTEAHKRGLEIHAWINTMHCFNTSDLTILEHPKHVSNQHPYWVYKKEEENGTASLWLNPGLPEVRKYLIDLIDELVQNYNIDGVQLDFIRYPKEPIDDIDSYSIYGSGKNLNDWRRENINTFVTELNIRIKTTNPLIKLGATPIGIYKNLPNARGLEGYNDVFQDSREWLASGAIDYAVPQIYWNIKDNPRYQDLVEDWNYNSHGKNVVIGIAAYRESVVEELSEEINIARSSNSDGVAFFRYSHIENIEINQFNEKTLPSEMPWIITERNLPQVATFISSDLYGHDITLQWQVDSRNFKNAKYLALYEIYNHNNSNETKLLKVVPSSLTSTDISIDNPDKIVYSYTVKAVDQLWNESTGGNIVSYKVPELKKISDDIAKFEKPLITKINGQYLLILSTSNQDQIDIKAANNNSQSELISSHKILPGLNIIKVSSEIFDYSIIDLEFVNSKRVVELKR